MTYGRRSSRAGTGYVCNGWKADSRLSKRGEA